MSPNPALASREHIASAIATLPDPLKDSNAAGFLKIVEQLKQSYIALLEIQASVKNVDASDPQAVSTLVSHLRDYTDLNTGELNEDRTRCGNIRRTERVMALDAPEAQQVKDMIQRLGSADEGFVTEIERAAQAALETAESMQRAALVADAVAAQEAYVARTEAEKAQIKLLLVEMNQIAVRLLDRI